MQNSLWAAGPELPSFPMLYGDLETDVLIIGGGLAGILCAWRLEQEGVDYALIEADRICHGVTRNTTAKITAQHGLIFDKLLRRFGPERARMYWDANAAALEQYRGLAQFIDCDFQTRDNFVFSLDPTEKLEKELAAMERLGIPGEFTDGEGLPFPVAGAIRIRDQAQFHPLKLAAGLAEQLRIYEHTPAREFQGNTVVTDRGKITAGKIIAATHFPILNKHGSYFLKLYQRRSYVLALENAGEVDGMYLEGTQDGISLRNYGNYLLLGGGGHRTGGQGGGWGALEAFARRYFPDAREKSRWATQDCMSLDGIPYIGQYSRRTPGLYAATGFNKWGMTSSMAAAMILGDLVQGKENPYVDVFSPSRSILRPQLLVNAGAAAAHLLTPTKPRCPHMGCALKWNPREHSWDCPCHGSRFGEEGELLDGPATGDLRKE